MSVDLLHVSYHNGCRYLAYSVELLYFEQSISAMSLCSLNLSVIKIFYCIYFTDSTVLCYSTDEFK